jgi:hypothetical protein
MHQGCVRWDGRGGVREGRRLTGEGEEADGEEVVVEKKER